MKLQDIKSKLYNFVIAEEDEFIIYNRQGVVIKEMTLQEVEDAIVNCESIKELANLIMEDWLYKDVYASFKELLADASAKRY
jgi:predicted transcriptional regulator